MAALKVAAKKKPFLQVAKSTVGNCQTTFPRLYLSAFPVLARQCLSRRIPDLNLIEQEIATWQQHHNQQRATVNWRFTQLDARDRRLYPVSHPSQLMWQSTSIFLSARNAQSKVVSS